MDPRAGWSAVVPPDGLLGSEEPCTQTQVEMMVALGTF